MSKALVIKGANFSSNKVETITLGDPIPCTGITINKSTITFTGINDTDTLTATVVPADTTDVVTWESSDTDVATVANGIVTCVGVGVATITVTCGAQSASCTVASTVTIVLDTAYQMANGQKYSGSMSLPTKDHIGLSTNDAKARAFYSVVDVLGGYQVFVNTINAGKYAIPIPNNAKNARLNFPSDLTEKKHVAFVLADTTRKQTYVTGNDGNAALGIYPYAFNNNTDAFIEIDFSDYADDANGFIMSFALISTSTTDITTITGTTSVVFS